MTTQTTPQKSSIKQRLRTDLGRSVGVTTATQLVWLTGLRAHLPTNRNNRLIKRTHIMRLLPWMKTMLDLICMGSVNLPGARRKRQNTK